MAALQVLCLSAAVATVALLKVGSLLHIPHGKGKQDSDTTRYQKLMETVPVELWDIAARIKAQRGICQVLNCRLP